MVGPARVVSSRLRNKSNEIGLIKPKNPEVVIPDPDIRVPSSRDMKRPNVAAMVGEQIVANKNGKMDPSPISRIRKVSAGRNKPPPYIGGTQAQPVQLSEEVQVRPL